MNDEQTTYLKELAALLHQGRRIAATTLCHSGAFLTIVWRITSEQGCTVEIIGRDQASGEQILLRSSFSSIWEVFGNFPFDPLCFTEDPNQEEE